MHLMVFDRPLLPSSVWPRHLRPSSMTIPHHHVDSSLKTVHLWSPCPSPSVLQGTRGQWSYDQVKWVRPPIPNTWKTPVMQSVYSLPCAYPPRVFQLSWNGHVRLDRQFVITPDYIILLVYLVCSSVLWFYIELKAYHARGRIEKSPLYSIRKYGLKRVEKSYLHEKASVKY